MTNVIDVLAFIQRDATDRDISAINDMIKERSKQKRALAAAAVNVGDQVTLDNLSPKYLNGLTGVVKSISGARGIITLDAESTQQLRYSGKRFYVSAGVTNYDLGGVPLSSCKVTTKEDA